MIERYEKFSYIISEIGKNLHKISVEEMQRFGLRGSWAKYLIALMRSEHGLTAGQMCEICDRNKADVSRAMSALEEDGMVIRCEGDSRYRVRFMLSSRGRQIAEAIAERANCAISFVSDMTEEERKIFYSALETIANNLEKLSENGIPSSSIKSPSDIGLRDAD